MRRVTIYLLCFVLFFSSSVLHSSNTQAAAQWCKRDPIILIDGFVTHFYTYVPAENQADVERVKLRVAIPVGSIATILYIEPGIEFDIQIVTDNSLVRDRFGTDVTTTWNVVSSKSFHVLGETTNSVGDIEKAKHSFSNTDFNYKVKLRN